MRTVAMTIRLDAELPPNVDAEARTPEELREVAERVALEALRRAFTGTVNLKLTVPTLVIA